MAAATLDDALKERIQDAYRRWLGARSFAPRRGQREMIAFAARCLGAGEVGVVEAGTGTGKTAAYCVAAIPVAMSRGKKLVIATATVALQEQIVERDLPDFRANTGLEFEFALAKGRNRYLCVKRLDDQLKEDDQQHLPIFDLADRDARPVLDAMLTAFASSRWNGELDSWADGVDETVWRSVTTDHRGCTGNRCSFFRQCPYFRARARLGKADVIVANQDLLLADLALGGGAVLTEPEETQYVIDEAHHLADKTQQHFMSRVRLRGAMAALEQVEGALGTLAQRMGRPAELTTPALELATLVPDARARLEVLVGLVAQLPFDAKDARRMLYRFPLGVAPAALAAAAAEAARVVEQIAEKVTNVHAALQEAAEGARTWERAAEAEDWVPVIGAQLGRAIAIAEALGAYASADQPRTGSAPPDARWAAHYDARAGGADDYELTSVPLDVGPLLTEALWSRCAGGLCTSATLTALGSFDRFLERIGLPTEQATLCIRSPFRYEEIATFAVPAMRSDPRDPAAHTAEVALLLPELLAKERSALVLFTSWRQLDDVVLKLPERLRARVKVQGNGGKQQLLEAHRQAVDRGEPSYVVGVASFAEGVDLPDDYCRHVIIAKLPFAVPDDPLDAAESEWVQANGRNPFFEISLPDAALRLVQACGRLIRHERDYGRITLLDRRIVTQRYGRALLDSLPPFKREVARS